MPAGKAHVASPRHSRASSPIRRWRTVSALVLNATLARPDVSLCVRSRPIGRETFTSLSATVTRFIPIADLAKLNEKVLADDTVVLSAFHVIPKERDWAFRLVRGQVIEFVLVARP